MTKEETQQMKGVAILMMVFTHLFSEPWKIGLYQSAFDLGETTIEQYLCGACNPVSFFLILSGYGLHYVYSRGVDKHRYSRIARSYIHYVAITIVFVGIACLLGKNIFLQEGNNIVYVVENLIGIDPTWNPHAWFLFPFSILSFLSQYVFKWTDRIQPLWLFVCALIWGLGTSFIVSRFGSEYLYPNRWVYNVFLPFHFLSSMIMGSLIHRCHWVERVRRVIGQKCMAQWAGYAMIVVMILIVCWASPLAGLYSIAFTILFTALHKSSGLSKVLAFLGDHSLNIWFVHGWLCCTLFMDFFFSFRYSILIWIVTLLASLLVSQMTNWFCRPIDKWISK